MTNTLINFFLTISTLFIGADIFGINVGVNLRLDQLFLFISFLLMMYNGKIRFYKKDLYIIILIISFSIPTFLSINASRSLLYLFSLVFNCLFVYILYSSYIRSYGIKRFVKILRKTLYISFIIFVAQFFLKYLFNFEIPFMETSGEFHGIYRFRLWFYEPSYLATFVLFWFTWSLYMRYVGRNKEYNLDLLFSFVMLVLSTSSIGYIGMGLSIILVYFLKLKKGITIRDLLFPLFICCLLGLFRLFMPNIYSTFVARIFNGDISGSSGGRITQWSETYDVFVRNKMFGVGPGCYGEYLGYDNDYVPSNVSLEILATAGILFFVLFSLFHLRIIIHSIRVSRKYNDKLLMAFVLGFMIFIIVLQANQNYFRLYHWMFLGILDGTSYYLVNRRKYDSFS